MRLTKRTKWILAAAALALVVILPALRPEVIPVDLVLVEPGTFTVSIDEDGVTRLRRHAELAAPVTGRLEASRLQAGDSVTRGQVVARLAPVPLDARALEQGEAALAAARSTRAAAEARVEQAVVARDEAVRARERAERLFAAGALAERDVEAAVAEERIRDREVTAARAGAEAAAGSERAARMALLGAGTSSPAGTAVVAVRSPMTGRVLRLLEEHERVVPAGTPLMDIGVPGDVEVVIDVLSGDATRIATGTPVVVRVPRGAELEARVERVDPAAFTRVSPLGVEEQRVSVTARLAGDATGLGDRFRVSASIVLWQGDAVLSVPSTSLVPVDGGWGVYVAVEGRARLRPVTVGRIGARSVEVTGGLAAGDVVVRHPDERIGEGVRITGSGQRAAR